MCSRIRARRSAGALSKKPTVNRTPPECQYLVVKTAMCSGVGANCGVTLRSRSMGGWLTGLMSAAVRAAEIHRSRGNIFGRHTNCSFIKPPHYERLFRPSTLGPRSHTPAVDRRQRTSHFSQLARDICQLHQSGQTSDPLWLEFWPGSLQQPLGLRGCAGFSDSREAESPPTVRLSRYAK